MRRFLAALLIPAAGNAILWCAIISRITAVSIYAATRYIRGAFEFWRFAGSRTCKCKMNKESDYGKQRRVHLCGQLGWLRLVEIIKRIIKSKRLYRKNSRYHFYKSLGCALVKEEKMVRLFDIQAMFIPLGKRSSPAKERKC